MGRGRGVWSGNRGGGDGGGCGGRGRARGGRGGHHDPAGREATGSGTHGGLGRRGVCWGCVEAVERAPHAGVLATPAPAGGGELRTVGELAGHVQAHVSLHLALKLHAVVLRGEERGLADAELPHAAGNAADHVDDASLSGTTVLVGQLNPLPTVVVVGVVIGEAPLPAVAGESGPEGGVGVERVSHDVLVRVAIGVGRGCVGGGIAGAPLLEALAGGSEGGRRGGLSAEGTVVLGVGGERGGDRGQEGAGHGGEGVGGLV